MYCEKTLVTRQSHGFADICRRWKTMKRRPNDPDSASDGKNPTVRPLVATQTTRTTSATLRATYNLLKSWSDMPLPAIIPEHRSNERAFVNAVNTISEPLARLHLTASQFSAPRVGHSSAYSKARNCNSAASSAWRW
jgi:hypothetical protein